MRWGRALVLGSFWTLSGAASHVWASGGTQAAAFLTIPVGGRPAAMGGAYSALANDAYAPTYNPGALGFLSATEISGQHLAYLESIHYEYLSAVHPLNAERTSALGVAAQYLGSGDITAADASGNVTGSFNTHYGAYAVAYGHRIGENLGVGASAKWINAKIADVGANAIAGDIGALYHATDRLSLAVSLDNFGQKLTFLNDGGSLPLAAHVGLAWQPTRVLTVSVEDAYEPDGLNSEHVGLEWSPLSYVALRAGYRTDTLKELGAMAGLSAGLGLKVWGQELAYAWVPYGDLGNTQYFSLTVRLGADEEARKNLIQYQSIQRHQTVYTPKQKPADHAQDMEYEQLMQLLNHDEAGQRVTENNAVPDPDNNALAPLTGNGQ